MTVMERVSAAFATMLSADGRRAWALVALVCGCGMFTALAAVGVYLVRDDPERAFWLAIAAHAQVFVGMTAIGALLVKRTVKLSREGIEISDGQRSRERDL